MVNLSESPSSLSGKGLGHHQVNGNHRVITPWPVTLARLPDQAFLVDEDDGVDPVLQAKLPRIRRTPPRAQPSSASTRASMSADEMEPSLPSSVVTSVPSGPPPSSCGRTPWLL